VLHKLQYRVLKEQFAVCRMAAVAAAPAWPAGGELYCATRTRDELSFVCPEHFVERAQFHQSGEIKVERGWLALKLEGPFPFSMTGVLASFLQPLAEARVSIFAISTFDTDYVLVKEKSLPQALAALRSAGHEELPNP